MEHTENAWWKCANPMELILMSIFVRRTFRFLLKMSKNGWNLGLNTSKKLGFWRENSKFLAVKILKIINGAKIPENYLNFSTKIQTKLKKKHHKSTKNIWIFAPKTKCEFLALKFKVTKCKSFRFCDNLCNFPHFCV